MNENSTVARLDSYVYFVRRALSIIRSAACSLVITFPFETMPQRQYCRCVRLFIVFV